MNARPLFWLAVVYLCLRPSFVRAVDVVVDPSGKGDVTTLQAAIDSLPTNGNEWARILIRPGRYDEHLAIHRPRTCLIGLGKDPQDVLITYGLSAKSPKPDGSGTVGTTGSASTFVDGNDFVAHNVTFANSTPDNVAQAVAIKTRADRLCFSKCRFLGFQDTLYPTGGRHYFRDCFVTGDTDFIFGNATAVFDRCEIHSSDGGYITAANTDPQTPVGFVFLDCQLTASPGVKAGSVYLGRPWQWDRGPVASVMFVRTRVGPYIAPAGWHPWDAARNVAPEKTTRYGEYGTMDVEGHPVDLAARVPWARNLADRDVADLTPPKILAGRDQWDPQAVVEDVVKDLPTTKDVPPRP
jgi:pectinesterase